MRAFLESLFSGDETSADSTITCGIAAVLVFFGLTIFAVVKDPSIWNGPAAWMGWGSAVGIVIGVVSGARTARARWSSGLQSATVEAPGEVTHVESKP